MIKTLISYWTLKNKHLYVDQRFNHWYQFVNNSNEMMKKNQVIFIQVPFKGKYWITLQALEFSSNSIYSNLIEYIF
jgi:hypothetical protein